MKHKIQTLKQILRGKDNHLRGCSKIGQPFLFLDNGLLIVSLKNKMKSLQPKKNMIKFKTIKYKYILFTIKPKKGKETNTKGCI